MVPSIYVTTLGYKIVIELKRSLKTIWDKNSGKKNAKDEMLTLIYKFFNAVDKSKSNTNYYKTMFESMGENEFNRYFKGFFEDNNAYLTLSIVDYEHNLTMEDIEAGAKVLNVPLFEYVSMPHITMDKSRVVTTKNPVPVGYILVKRPQQTSIYRLFLLLNNDNKMIGLYKPLELLETPLRTISSTLCPTTNESLLTQVVY